MRALRGLSAILVAISGFVSPVFADDDDASIAATPLDNAVALYLADNDASALPAIAGLAARGDTDAQILLGEIALEPETSWSAWRRGLSAEERAAIFGPSGASWTATAAAAGDAGAKALIAARAADAGMTTAHALEAAGHVERAKTLAWNIMEQGRIGDVLTLEPEAPLYRKLDYLWWLLGWTKAGHLSGEPVKWVTSSPVEGRASGLILTAWVAQFVAADKPLPAPLERVASALTGRSAQLMKAEPPEVAAAEKMAATLARRDPEFAPVGSVCARVCDKAEQGRCALDALRILGGYDKLMKVDPPHEPLINARAFGRSDRVAAMVERMLRAAAPGAKGAPLSACLSNALDG